MDTDYNLMIGDFGFSKKMKENTLKFSYAKNIGGIKNFLSPEIFTEIFG